jgi:hypothetical protein
MSGGVATFCYFSEKDIFYIFRAEVKIELESPNPLFDNL